MTAEGEVDEALERAQRDLVPIALAANCAGIANAAPADEMAAAQWQRMFDVNLTGLFRSPAGAR